MALGRLLEACQVHEKVALEHSSKSTKYELKDSYNDPVSEHFLRPNCPHPPWLPTVLYYYYYYYYYYY